MAGYDNLMNYFRTNFSLRQHHGYSITEIENWMPWEKFVYIDMLQQHIKHEEDVRRDREAQLKAQANIRRR
jgi:hypothetical protein